MNQHFQLDSLDKQILTFLSTDSRMSFLEIARKCNVSGALIHQRVDKMKTAGIIMGYSLNLSPKKMGYLSTAYVGIKVALASTNTQQEVFERISEIPEVVECHHITGQYSLFLKIYARDNEHLKDLLVKYVQSIPEVASTETFISLQEGFDRQLPID